MLKNVNSLLLLLFIITWKSNFSETAAKKKLSSTAQEQREAEKLSTNVNLWSDFIFLVFFLLWKRKRLWWVSLRMGINYLMVEELKIFSHENWFHSFFFCVEL